MELRLSTSDATFQDLDWFNIDSQPLHYDDATRHLATHADSTVQAELGLVSTEWSAEDPTMNRPQPFSDVQSNPYASCIDPVAGYASDNLLAELDLLLGLTDPSNQTSCQPSSTVTATANDPIPDHMSNTSLNVRLRSSEGPSTLCALFPRSSTVAMLSPAQQPTISHRGAYNLGTKPVRLHTYDALPSISAIDCESTQDPKRPVAQNKKITNPPPSEIHCHKSPIVAAGLPTPCTADMRLIGNTTITCEELLAYLPRHLSIEMVLRRLQGNGWGRADICAAVNYFRDWTKRGEALVVNTVTHKMLALEKRHRGHKLNQAQRDEFYKPVWDFTAQAWSNPDPRRKPTDNLLTDLADGVVPGRRPTGAAAGPLSKCIAYAEQHPELHLRLSDVQQIIIEQGFGEVVPVTSSNIDFEAWDRMRNVIRIRKYRYPLGEASGKGRETSNYSSARRVQVRKAIEADAKAKVASKASWSATYRHAPY